MKNTKNNVTELVFIIDRSGSMSGFEKDTVGGFNSILKEQKEKDGKVYVSTVFFDNDSQVIHDRLDINEVEPLTEKDYRVGGCTALLDALGDAIRHIGNIHKYARPEDVPEHTMFVITTDGQENASHKYSSREIKKKISRQSEKHGWEFLFLAANIDAVDTAESIGIKGERAANFTQSSLGVEKSYAAMSAAISAVREERTLDDCCWKNDII
ncbi:MAG: VWA domain-containing protein [Clostridia bacterium]|nr:VWA domain-containing protein [Clostridia bacterium]